MNKEFISYKQALVLKELGFDEPVIGFYNHNNPHYECGYFHMSTEHMSSDDITTTKQSEFCVSAPTYSQAFRWFREKHNLYNEINLDSYKEPYSLKVTIKHLDDTNTFVDKEYYPYSNGIGDIDNKKYEEAESACLDKLIEIVKNG
jgi:hypothetical protein